jgi:hypothetical protein
LEVRHAVRDRDEESFGAKDTPDLLGGDFDVGYVVQHVRSQDEVEASLQKGEALDVGEYDRRVGDERQHSNGEIHRYPRTTVTPPHECTFVCSVAAPDIEDALGRSVGDPRQVEHPGEKIELRHSAAG